MPEIEEIRAEVARIGGVYFTVGVRPTQDATGDFEMKISSGRHWVNVRIESHIMSAPLTEFVERRIKPAVHHILAVESR